MRRLYFTVSVVFITAVCLFVGTFFYLDRSKHATFHFIMNLEGNEIGTFKVDKFETEEKIIIKSYSDIPFFRGMSETKEKAEYSQKYAFEDFAKERYGSGAAALYHLSARDGTVSFLAKYNSRFLYLDEIPAKRNIFIFDKGSPASFIPLIDNYDFRKKGAQVLSIFMNVSDELPPARKIILLNTIRDEYVTSRGRRLRASVVAVRIKGTLNAVVWVAVSDRSIARIEIPEDNVVFTRCAESKVFDVKNHVVEDPSYETHEVEISNKNIDLAGAFTVPKSGAIMPAVILIPGPGPSDRDYDGLFLSAADHLARAGYCVLRYDKRGIGQSSGDYAATSLNDETSDLSAAVDFIMAQKEVDPRRVALVSHSTGALFALKMGSVRADIAALILMSPDLPSLDARYMEIEKVRQAATTQSWGEAYRNLVIKAIEKTRDKAGQTNQNWALIMGRLCYVKRIKELMAEQNADAIIRQNKPILILQGSDNNAAADVAGTLLDKLLAQHGKAGHALKYFSYLGARLGKRVNDGAHAIYYVIDNNVMDHCVWWLGANMPVIQKEPAQETETANKNPIAKE